MLTVTGQMMKMSFARPGAQQRRVHHCKRYQDGEMELAKSPRARSFSQETYSVASFCLFSYLSGFLWEKTIHSELSITLEPRAEAAKASGGIKDTMETLRLTIVSGG
jgi:hypothetical protein